MCDSRERLLFPPGGSEGAPPRLVLVIERGQRFLSSVQLRPPRRTLGTRRESVMVVVVKPLLVVGVLD